MFEENILEKMARNSVKFRKQKLLFGIIAFSVMILLFIWSAKEIHFQETRLDAAFGFLSNELQPQSDDLKTVIRFMPGIFQNIQRMRALATTQAITIVFLAFHPYQIITGRSYERILVHLWKRILEIEKRIDNKK